MKKLASIFVFSCLIFLISCGKDKLNSKLSTSTSNLNGGVCSCTTSHSPVCGVDGKDYDNACQAQCLTTVAHVGHCDCATNTVPVCGSDGKDHTECEALAPNSGIAIVKWVPCAATEI